MPRKKKEDQLVQASLGHRISKHEAICAERMKTLFKSIEEMRKDIKAKRERLVYRQRRRRRMYLDGVFSLIGIGVCLALCYGFYELLMNYTR